MMPVALIGWRRDVLASGRKKRVAIEMRLAMVRECVERLLDRGLIADTARSTKQREPGRALAIVGEQPVHIGPRDEAVWRANARRARGPLRGASRLRRASRRRALMGHRD